MSPFVYTQVTSRCEFQQVKTFKPRQIGLKGAFPSPIFLA